MNRVQAIAAIARSRPNIAGDLYAPQLVDALTAVGVLKLEEPASAASKWKVGDVVTLASGGPRMTVVQISTGTHFQVTVEWYGFDGAKCNDRLPQDALMAAHPAEPDKSPLVKISCVWGGGGQACCRLDTLIDDLRIAGYEVRRK